MRNLKAGILTKIALRSSKIGPKFQSIIPQRHRTGGEDFVGFIPNILELQIKGGRPTVEFKRLTEAEVPKLKGGEGIILPVVRCGVSLAGEVVVVGKKSFFINN